MRSSLHMARLKNRNNCSPKEKRAINILKMAKEGLRSELELALSEYREGGQAGPRWKPWRLKGKEDYQIFDILPVNPLTESKGLSVVAFIEKDASKKSKKKRRILHPSESIPML